MIYEVIVSARIWTSLYSVILQGRNPYNFWLIFCKKRWLHKSILKFSDLYTTINKITQLYKKQTIYYHLTYWLDHIILVVHQLGFSIYIFKVVNLLLNTCRDLFFSYLYLSLKVYFFWFDTWIRPKPLLKIGKAPCVRTILVYLETTT